MTSIIDYYKAHNLSYTASGSDSNFPYSNAFEKNDKYYQSYDKSPNYWQITFQNYVTIDSYIISCTTQSWWTTIWKITFSPAGDSTFFEVKTYSKSIKNNKEIFKLPYPIICKTFRITATRDSDDESNMLFNSFDCFAPAFFFKKKCSCNCHYYKKILAMRISLIIYPSLLA